MKNLLLLLALAGVLAVLAACGGSEEAAPKAEQAAGQAAAEPVAAEGSVAAMAADIKANCVRCHGLAKVCDKIGKAGMPEWGATLGFMMSKGAVLSAASITQFAEFLADEAAARPALCE